MTALNNTHTKYKTKLLLTIIIVLCFIFGGGFYILKQSNITNNKDNIVELTPDFIEAIQRYEKLKKFSEGYAAVCKDDKWGYINTKGKEIIQCQYSDVNSFHEGYAAVCKDDKWGYVNTQGEELVKCQYSDAFPFYEGYAAVCKDDKWGYVNTEGKEIIQCQYSVVNCFFEGLAAVLKNGKWSYIDTKGEEVIPINIEAEFAGRFSEGLAFIYKDENNFSVIDTKGDIIFSGNCDFSWYFKSNIVDESHLPRYFQGELYIPSNSSNFTVYDSKGNKIKETDEYLGNKSEMPYTVFAKENGNIEGLKYLTVGLKDANDKELIPAIYKHIGVAEIGENIDVSNGVVLVVLNEMGENVVECYAGEFDSFYSNDEKWFYGYADLKGHDTFSEELKKKCKESYERAVNKLFQQKVEEKGRLNREGPDWLQGAWRMQLTDDYGRHLGYMYEVFNHGTSKAYANGSLISERNYTVSDDMVIYENNGYYQLDNGRQIIISADGQKMQKVSNDTSYSPTSYSSSSFYSDNGNSNNRQEKEYMLKLSKLSDKGKELVNELSSMRANGNIDPFRIMYIKQNLIRYKDEQIDIAANKLHDSQLAREYMEQKRKLLLAFKQMGI